MGKEIIPVVAAVITKGDGRDSAFLLHRKTEPRNPELVGKLEYPGGMIEYGESPEEALRREIREELEREVLLGMLIEAKTFLPESGEHFLILYYHCLLPGDGQPIPKDCIWVEPGRFQDLDCLEEVEEVATEFLRLKRLQTLD